MNTFETQLIIPDKQDSISGFFRVICPSLFLVGTVAFIHAYYATNLRPVPFLLNYPLSIFTIVMLAIWLLRWYHQLYQKKGTFRVDENGFEYTLDNIGKTYRYGFNDVKDITFVYDGFVDTFGPAKGTENQLRFKDKNGTPNTLYFLLESEEKASDIAKVLKTWYAQNISFKEYDRKGQKRNLLVFSQA